MKVPVCPKCKGLGFVDVKDDDKVFVRPCDCRIVDTFMTRCEKANIPKRFREYRFESYHTKDDKSKVKAKRIVQKFVDNYPGVTKGLLLQGSTGLGKTQLLCTIATEIIRKFDKEIDIYYIDWNDLVREMRTGEGTESRDFVRINSLLQRLVDVELLLFDELGATKISPWVQDNIYYLINKRYHDEKITILSTNYYDKEYELENGTGKKDKKSSKDEDGEENPKQKTLESMIGRRIRSRLYEMTITVEIFGEDVREAALKSSDIES